MFASPLLSSLPDNKNEKKEPMFFARSPEKIKHSKNLPCIDSKYEETLTQGYAKANGIEWTDTMLATQKHRDMLWQDKKYEKTANYLIEERLHQPLDSLMICDINSEVGKGVFVLHDAKPIPAGTIIGIYAGELESSFLSEINNYSMSLTCDEHQNSIISQEIFQLRANGYKKRNIISFIQDAPDDLELKKIHVISDNSFAKENIASANLCILPTIYKGCPISYAITIRELKPKEQLLFSYEGNFWGMKNRCVFNKEGRVIGQFISDKIKLKSEYTPTKEMSAPRFHRETARDAILKFNNAKKDTYDAGKRLYADVISCLETHANRYKKGTTEWNYIEQLREAFTSSDKISTQFNNLHNALSNENSKTLLSSLGLLRSELVFHMKKYQKTKPKPMLKTKAPKTLTSDTLKDQRTEGVVKKLA